MVLHLQIEASPSGDTQSPTQMNVETGSTLIIGRGAQAGWVLSDPNKHISAQHCLIEGKSGGFFLTDKSTNGTFVNGGAERVNGPHKLASGDVLKVGPCLIRCTISESSSTPVMATSVQNLQRPTTENAPQVHRRGQDPAAVAAAVPQLIADKGVLDSVASMTKIRPFVPPPAAPVEPPMPLPNATASARSSTTTSNTQSVSEGNEILHSIELGLGVKLQSADFGDPLLAVQQLARTVKVLTEQLDTIVSERIDLMRALGSRREYLVSTSQMREPRLIDALPEIIRQSTDPKPIVAAALRQLAAHDQSLIAAIRSGADKMARAISPPAQEGANSELAASRWLQDYVALWQGLGPDWASRFAAALILQIVFAFDSGAK